MPRRTDLKRVLIVGSGPIVIGQACEFDYSGSQACKALRAEGLEVVLVNSNPATIMTDPDLADRTYVEPLTPDVVAAIIERERPDAVLPTVGGQTALNLAVDLANAGTLDRFKVKLIGASIQAIKVAENRQLFKDAMRSIGLDVPQSGVARSLPEAVDYARTLGFPLVIRPSFTLGGVGGGIAYNIEEFRELAGRGLELSPVHEILVEESVIGWKEFELEVMRDVADNFVVVCSIENIDPMGVHTGDSITVAPILTLTDKEYQRMRDAARRVISRVGEQPEQPESRGRYVAAQAARDSERPPHVGSVPRDRARLERRADSRGDEHRSVVPPAVRGDCGDAPRRGRCGTRQYRTGSDA